MSAWRRLGCVMVVRVRISQALSPVSAQPAPDLTIIIKCAKVK